MSYVVAWVGTKDGQGCTSTMLATAHEIARTHSVLVVDADMSGTATAIDHLHLHPRGRGMNNLVGVGRITREALLRQAIPTRTSRLELVPGLMAIYGTGTANLVQQLESGGALSGLPHDFVLLDLGCAWSHPMLDAPRAAAEAVARISSRVLVVVQDSPTRIARSIQVLQAAQPPKAELVLMETRRGTLSRQVEEALAARLPSVGLAARVRWDPRRAVRAENQGVPVPDVGEAVVRGAQLVDGGRAWLRAAHGAPAGSAP